MAAADDAELPLAEHVCLALVGQGATHGWQVGTLLGVEGEVGRIWSLSRPLTYRALEQLADKGLVRRSAAKGTGRERQLLKATAGARRITGAWLDRPVEHLRDVRTELLLKLELRRRAGLDPAPLLRRQREAFADVIAALAEGPPPDDLVGLWRRESARAVRRFLDAALAGRLEGGPEPVAAPLLLSARNQLGATVRTVVHGDVLSTVKAAVHEGQEVTAVITGESVAALDLAAGDEVVVVIKSTEVMIAKRGATSG